MGVIQQVTDTLLRPYPKPYSGPALSVLQADYAHRQLVTMLTSHMLFDIGSSVDSLAMGRTPTYLVPLSLVQDILAT